VTVCIAGIHEDREGSSLMLICDRRVSLFGGLFSQDGYAKYTQVHRDWVGMFAGSIEETHLMLQEVRRAIGQLKVGSFEKVVKCCRLSYMNVRKRLIETRILPDYDMASYLEFTKATRSDEALYLKIREKITEAEEGWNLLFAGFDNTRTPHIFIVSGPGNVEYCDSQKVAAIGSGAFAALFWISFYGYHSRRSLGELLFGAISAKFFAERAQDVGQTTVVTTIRSDIHGLFHFNDDEIRSIRDAWNGLPKYSEGAVKQLESRMAAAYGLVRHHATK
jgi:hypothetical protein